MKYRPHIDGLRTLAIVPVVLFHADVAPFSGGFTGVDVFFVISGFLITRLIVEDIRNDRFSILGFYKRRALRILPAYLALILAVVAASYVVLLPDETRSLGRSVVAASLFVSNILFWRSTDYFDPALETEPLLHTWTLSVEEQYYILLPVFLLLVARYFGGRYTVTIAVVSGLSFALSVWGVGSHETASFFLLPTRIWEFGLGSLAAVAGSWAARGGRLRPLGAGLGAMLLGYGAVGLDAASVFPGPNALFPALGALLLIVCAEGTWADRLLSSAPMVAIGRISYSLYLWHWPIIVFYKMWYGPVLGPADVTAVVAASVLAAAVSFRWIEQPFRTPRIRRRPAGAVIGTALTSLAGAVMLGGMLMTLAERWGNHTSEIRRIADYLDYREGLAVHDCVIHARRPGGYEAFDPETCLAPSANRPTLLVLGDSHAEHLIPAIERQFKDFNVQAAGATGCTPTLDVDGEEYCPRLIRMILDEHVPKGGVDGVILSARWSEDDIEPLQRTASYLSRHVDRVFILGPTPEFLDSFPRILARNYGHGGDTVERFLDLGVRDLDRRMKTINWADKVTYISMYDLICPDTCRLFTQEKVPYIFDYGHYTREAADEIMRLLDTQGLIRLNRDAHRPDPAPRSGPGATAIER